MQGVAVTPEVLQDSVRALHESLLDCIGLMGIGSGATKKDTVAEEGGNSASSSASELGDVK